MTILFWYRKNVRSLERPGTINCRITIDREEYNFATVVRIFKVDWDATRQCMRGRTDEAKVANQQLQQLADGLREAYNILEREGTFITPKRVIERYQQPQARQLSLLALSTQYLESRDSQLATGAITLNTREADGVRLSRLAEWLSDTKQLELRPAEFTHRKATQMLHWLQGGGRSRNYAITVLGAVRGLLRWCVQREYLDRHPMDGFHEGREPPKPLVFLTPAELVKLWHHNFHTLALRKVADVFLFQCFTGLAWQDAYNFRASEHLISQPSGAVLLRVERQKTGTPMVIPFFRPASHLLAKYGGEQLPVAGNQYLNRALKEIAYLLGFKQHLTTHVGRKTAGMILLQDGVGITIVSKVLGHKSISVTQRHYADVLPDTMINELSKVYGPEVLGVTQATKPFLREFTELLLLSA